MSAAKLGDRVRIHYIGRVEDGTIFDSSHGRDPLEFTAGGSGVIPGVSLAVLGMRLGESKTITLDPENAYGEWQPNLERRVSRGVLPQGAQVGDPLHARVRDETIVVWVKELGKDFGVLDLNHPLAGQTLTIEMELVALESNQG